jgi:hypothetical protein
MSNKGCGCDLICLFSALDRHSCISNVTAHIKENKSMNYAREELDKHHTVIPHTHYCARFSFCFTVGIVNFLMYLLWTTLYVSGRGPVPSNGVYLPNLMDISQQFSGRTFSDIWDCETSNAFEFNVGTYKSQSKKIDSAQNGLGCPTQIFQNYFDNCFSSDTLKAACTGRRLEKSDRQCTRRDLRKGLKCKNKNCQESMFNVYTCLERGNNNSFRAFNMSSHCGDPPASKKSFERKVAPRFYKNDTSTWLTRDEHGAILLMRYCFTEDCKDLTNRVFIQSFTTIVFTVLFETLFEKGINTCSRKLCSPYQFAVSFTAVEIVLLLAGAIVVNNQVNKAFSSFIKDAKQRCIYTTLTSMKIEVFVRFMPILCMTWFINLVMLLVQGFIARRKDLKESYNKSTDDNGKSDDQENQDTENQEKTTEMMANPMKKN